MFDTVIVRTVGHPSSVFDLAASRISNLLPLRIPPGIIARQRAESERVLDITSGQPTLLEIYEHLIRTLSLTLDPNLAVQQELTVELEVCRPAPRAFELLRLSRMDSTPLMFISETYHSSAFVRELLERENLCRETDHVFVSCELKASKANGQLYMAIQNLVQVPPSELRHLGDSEVLDLQAARRAGWSAERAAALALTPIEQSIEDLSCVSGGIASRLAGSLRYTREVEAEQHHSSVGLQDLLAYLAPSLIAFVDWVFEVSEDLDQVLFVSRDGELLKKIFDQRYPHRSTAYVYGSRAAFSRAKNDPQTAAMLADHLRDLGLRDTSRWALVDLGWHGVSAANALEALAGQPFQLPRLIYFGLYTVDSRLDCCDIRCFSFDYQNGESGLLTSDSVAPLLEIACAGTHGEVLGYQRLEKDVRPLLASIVNREAIHWGLEDWQRMVVTLSKTFPVPEWVWERRVLASLSLRMLDDFLRTPSGPGLEAVATFPFSSESASTETRRFARPLACRQLLQLGLTGTWTSYWRAGDLALSKGSRELALTMVLTTRKSASRFKRRVLVPLLSVLARLRPA